MSDKPCSFCNSASNNYIPNGITKTLSHGECAGITIDLLTMFLNLVKCLQRHGSYAEVTVSETEAASTKTILETWIIAKELDPTTCEYQEKLPLIQAVITKIVAYGRC